MLKFDHIAVSGETLEAATSHVEQALGVELQPGGEHAVFHTHNTLLGLADGLYLEAIAVNPDAPDPDRPRWFDLDRFSGPPRLTNWICRTADLGAALRDIPAELGEAVDLQRGELRWRMAVPQSGVLPYDNCAPALIEWQTEVHPATKLAQKGVRLMRLTIQHPNADALRDTFAAYLSDDRVRFEQGDAGYYGSFETPHGMRVLE
jgi:hypothetical protein